MRARRLSLIGAAVALALAIPAAGAAPTKGTWTFTDTTPDPTTLQNPATEHCHGTLPASPLDVNNQKFKAPAKGWLTLTSHNAMDWAVEVHDKKGNVIGGTDGGSPTDPENLQVAVKKSTYTVVYCSFAGEPQITVDYKFKRG
jgi:hypothetical protein